MDTRQNSILLVEDNEELRAMVRQQLTLEGYDVDEAGDGLGAIEKAKRRTYALMLLDITMPGKSGLDVLRFVKKHTPSCKIIMLTGIAGLSAATQSIKLGAEDYITKPYNPAYLLSSVRNLLEQEKNMEDDCSRAQSVE